MMTRGIPTVALSCISRRHYPVAVVALARLLARQRMKVLHLHLFEASVVGCLAARLARTPLTIFTGHHSHEVMINGRRVHQLTDRLVCGRLTDRIIAPSRYMREKLVSVYGIAGHRIATLPYGFDFSHWIPCPGAGERLRGEWSVSGGVLLGAVGRHFWVKNYPTLLRAFRTIVERWPRTRLVLIGDGPDRERNAALIHELGLNDKVILAGHRDDIVNAMAALDALVHPSRCESFGQVIVEAFALGKPVLSLPVGIASELVEDNVTGFLVKDTSIAAMELGLRQLLKVREQWSAMGEEGKRRVGRFASAHVVPKWEKQYAGWLGELGRFES